MNPFNWRAWSERPQINRSPSRVLARSAPWLSVMLGSLASVLLWVASAPIMPPFGLLMLIGWRQLRPGLLPVWAGLPLGAFDDLYSGQPFGSAVLLWSVVTLALDAIEERVPWRGFLTDWGIAAVLIAASTLLGAALVNLTGGAIWIALTGPQILFAILAYPLIGRIVGVLDRLRLVPIIDIGRQP